MNPFPLILADLRAMRITAVFSVLLIALSIAMGIAVSAQERALRKASARAADDFPLLIGAAGSETQLVLSAVYLQPYALPLLDGATLKRLAGDPRVSGLSPVAPGDIYRGWPIVGVAPELVTRWGRVAPFEGRVFLKMGEAVLGSEVRLRMGEEFFATHGRAGDKHAPGEEDEDEDQHRHDNGAFVAVGRMPATGSPFDRAILVPIESVWAIHGQSVSHGGDLSRLGPPFDGDVPGVPAVVVRPKQVADAYQLRSEYRHNGALALFPAEVLTSIYQSLGDVRDLLVAASAANNLLLLASILMLATILVGLRRRRYAVLRALGATRTFVALTIWGGLVSLLAIGASLGLLLGFGAARLLSTWMQMRSGLALAPALGDGEILFSLGIFLVGALLMGAVSTVMALKGDVAKQLRF